MLKEKTSKRVTDKNYNILIEGNNLHTLSILNYTHKEKIDVIYIDPPYNRDGDFKYNDKIVNATDSYKHSKWISFMVFRLKLARNLLKDDGMIFISIDANELFHLKLLCDMNIFGEANFLACITWRQLHTVKNNANHFSVSTEYILVYAKNKVNIKKLRQTKDKSADYRLDDNDGRGKYKLDPLHARNKNTEYEFYFDKWDIVWKAPIGSYPRYSKNTLKKMYDDNEIVYQPTWKEPKAKRYLNMVQMGVPPSTYWDGKDVGFNSSATQELGEIIPRDAFKNPKPLSLVKRCLDIGFQGKKKGIVLDFFAGSGTTGHAVLQLNKEDGGNRKFILCTNNENDICTNVCYPRCQKVMRGYRNPKGNKIEGLGSGLVYYKVERVEKEPGSVKSHPPLLTDANKHRIIRQVTEMLCLKEWCFDRMDQTNSARSNYAIYRDKTRYFGIIYNSKPKYVRAFTKAIDEIESAKRVPTYVFSDIMSSTLKNHRKVVIKPIPTEILQVWRRMYAANNRRSD